jgi:hypothetical protein
MSEGRMMTDPIAVREFVLAGNARITLKSKLSGTRFSYRVRECEGKEGLFFVGLLSGSDNESAYSYMGVIRDGNFSVTKKSHISAGAPSAMAFDFFWKYLLVQRIHSNLEVWHEGHCGRCGRTLTVPESIERGIGPECASKMGVAA